MARQIGFDGFRGCWIRHGTAAALSAALMTTVATASLAGGKFKSFDVPGAKGGTFAVAINSSGQIAGDYGDAKSVAHGFLRNADGTFATFDAGHSSDTAGRSPDTYDGTYAFGINANGTITGYFLQGSSVYDGFVRTVDGKITIFDAPGGTGATAAIAINDNGVIAGDYDSSGADHGFLRAPSGKIKVFDPPDSVDTTVTSINNKGAIAGSYDGTGGLYHGFLRTSDGAYTTFDVSGNVSGTFPSAINDKGAIAGIWNNSVTGAFEGFVRGADGTITTFDPSGSTDTFVTGIDDKGAIVGYYESPHGNHGFVRGPSGTIKSFGPSGSATYANGINDKGVITGFYNNSNGDGHGFVRSP